MTQDPLPHPLPPGTRILVLGSGKAGQEAHCKGVAAALGGDVETLRVRPRAPFRWLAPWGPADPRDAARAPWPDIAIASGRVTVPYLRALKSASKGRVFAVFLEDPRGWRASFDLIWAPEHDAVTGPNIMKTLGSPHTISAAVLTGARAAPDPRVADLAAPRLAMVLGGDSAAYRFARSDIEALVAIARGALRDGWSVMATPSRRTPAALREALSGALADAPAERAFFWDGAGDNPYVQMLAQADALLVTSDSVNMVAEAAATGAPVHVYEPTGGAAKIRAFIEGMVAYGAVRRWNGAFERWTYEPMDVTGDIAREIERRYARRSSS